MQDNSSGNQNNLFNQTDLATAFSTGALTHSVLLGAELGLQQTSTLRFNGTASTVAAVNPVLTPPVYGTTPATNNEFTGTYGALYLQDEISIRDRWRAPRRTPRRQLPAPRRSSPGEYGPWARGHRVQPRAGLVFKAQQNVSLYGSVSRSFLPSGDGLSLATNNADLEPEQTISYEGGVKAEVLRHRLTLTSSVFRLDRTNVKTTDPLDPTRLVPSAASAATAWSSPPAARSSTAGTSAPA